MPDHAHSSIDWSAIKAEFLGGTTTLNALRIKHNIDKRHFYRKVRGWDAARKKLQASALAEVEQEIKTELRDRYTRFADSTKTLLEAALEQVEQIYKKTRKKRGIKPIKSGEVLNIVNALQGAIKSFRLIEGKSTENISDTRGPEYWRAMIEFTRGQMPKPPKEYEGQLPPPE